MAFIAKQRIKELNHMIGPHRYAEYFVYKKTGENLFAILYDRTASLVNEDWAYSSLFHCKLIQSLDRLCYYIHKSYLFGLGLYRSINRQ
jgi:hypothetical protein